MAGKFWFGKRNITNGIKDIAGSADASGAGGGAVVMTDAVFPVGFGEEEDFSVNVSDLVLDKVKRDIESVKKSVAKQKRTLENRESLKKDEFRDEQSDSIPQAGKKEESVNFNNNRSTPTFKTVSIPGVVDGGTPEGKPVMTPVRMAVSTAPIKLKSLTEKQESGENMTKPPAQTKLTTSALKVVNTDSKPLQKDEQPRFGLHVRKKEEPVATKASVSPGVASIAAAPADAVARDTVPSDYVKPKNDQRVLYYQLMNGLYDAVLVLDGHGHVVDCNDRVQKVLGYSREEAWDLPIEKVIKGMNSQMFAHLKKNLEENHNVLITARCYKSGGDSFKGEIGVSTLSLTRAHNVVFAIRNVDQRKNIMAELRKAGAAFDIALASAFACTPDGFFTNVNKTLMESFGIPDAKEAMKVRFIDVMPDAARSFSKVLNGEYIRERLVVTDAEGQKVKVDIALAPIKNGTEVTGVAGSILPL